MSIFFRAQGTEDQLTTAVVCDKCREGRDGQRHHRGDREGRPRRGEAVEIQKINAAAYD